MVITKPGDDPNTTLTTYAAPDLVEIVHLRGRTYVFDAGSGDLIAALSDAAADAIRAHRPTLMIYNGSTLQIANPEA